MKRFKLLALIAIMGFYCNVLAKTVPNRGDGSLEHLRKCVPNQVLWQVKEGVDIPVFDTPERTSQTHLNQVRGLASVVNDFQVTRIEKSFKRWSRNDRISRTYTVHFEDYTDAYELLNSLDRLSSTELSELMPIYEVHQSEPNDEFYQDESQFYLDNIDTEGVWDIENCGTGDVVIAVLDDAFLTTHEDLIGNLVAGKDVGDDDYDVNPPSGSIFPAFGHGTFVASITAATTNNNLGMASIGHTCSIMPIKIAKDADPPGTVYWVLSGLEYAIEEGVDVINMSFGGNTYSTYFEYLLQVAYDEGIVCVTSAGNSGSSTVTYPGGYDRVVTVGATGGANSDIKDSMSNYGEDIDLMAPGVNIVGARVNGSSTNSYITASGTSAACPYVSGLAGLYICANNGNELLSPDNVINCMKANALNIDSQNPGFEGQLGFGLIQVASTLGCELLTTPSLGDCKFHVEQTCYGSNVELIMYDNWGYPVQSGVNGIYTFRIIWNYNETSYIKNPIPVTIPIGESYEAILQTYIGDELICSTTFEGVAEPCLRRCNFTVQEDCDAEEQTVELTLLDGNGNPIEPGTNGYTYQIHWNYNFTTYPNQNPLIPQIPVGDSYEVILTVYLADELICSNSYETTVVCSGKRAFDNTTIDFNQVSIYPNPSNQYFNVQFEALVENAQIEVFDLSGKQVLSQKVNETTATSIDISRLKPAVYMVKIEVEREAPIFEKLAITR